jgi:hypothetical protein
MTIRSDQVAEVALPLAATVIALNVWYSYKTGYASAWVMQISRKNQPIMFRIAVISQSFMSALLVLTWILGNLGVIN